MGYTVIPRDVKIDGKTITKNNKNEVTLSPQIMKEILDNIIDITLLDVKTSSNITSKDDFVEVFSTETGYMNSVDTSQTTARFNTDHYDNLINAVKGSVIYTNNNQYSKYCDYWNTWYTVSSATVNDYVYEVSVTGHKSNSSNAAGLGVVFHYEDGTTASQRDSSGWYIGTSPTTRTYQNPNKTKKVVSIDIQVSGYQNTVYVDNYSVTNAILNPDNAQIVCNISLSNASNVYAVLYDKNGKMITNGNAYVVLTDGTNDINVSLNNITQINFTPTQAKIVLSNDKEYSVKKLVLLGL